MDKGLGRVYIPDERDGLFRMKALLSRVEQDRDYRHWWSSGWNGDQGPYPHCVGYAWAHWLEAGPVTYPKWAKPVRDPVDIYRRAQKLDEWAGEGYDGTSVRGGAKVLVEEGLIESYWWGMTVDEILKAVLEVGPVVVGTDWTSDMTSPDSKGYIKPSGVYQGGHAYTIVGARVRDWFRVSDGDVEGDFRVLNSWGRSWGQNGRAWIRFSDMQDLISGIRWPGEACLAMERVGE